MQILAIPMCPDTAYQGEEFSTSLCTSPPLEAVGNSEITPLPPSLQTSQTQCPQQLLRGHSCQSLPLLWCPWQNTFKDLHIPLQWQDPELHTAFKMRPTMLDTAG